MCEDAATVVQLVKHAESDAWLALGLAVYLSAIPLTLQLSALSGFLWSRTLQGNRAQRIEMLLLHEFHRRKFLLPDKPEKWANKGPAKSASKSASKSATAAADGGDAEQEEAEGGAEKPVKAEPRAKGPQYAGASQPGCVIPTLLFPVSGHSALCIFRWWYL